MAIKFTHSVAVYLLNHIVLHLPLASGGFPQNMVKNST